MEPKSLCFWDKPQNEMYQWYHRSFIRTNLRKCILPHDSWEEFQSIFPLFQETNIQNELGCDEAGRGTLFGRMYACGVIWDLRDISPDEWYMLPHIRDSKTHSRKRRNELREFIEKKCKYWCMEWSEPQEVDEINILEANRKCFKRILSRFKQNDISVDKVVFDGNQFSFPFLENCKRQCIEQRCVPKADAKYISVASASILAKEYHDEYVQKLSKIYPELDEYYDLSHNVGYATEVHRNGIEKHGITNLHRKTFRTCHHKPYILHIKEEYEEKPQKMI